MFLPVSDLLILKIYDSFCVAALMVMSLILIVSNVNKQKFEERNHVVTQSEATLLYLIRMGKLKAQKALEAEIAHRKRDDHNVLLIWNHLFGKETSFGMLLQNNCKKNAVDETNCLKMLKKTYEHHCGVLSTYGLKYIRTFRNICSAGFSREQMVEAVSYACPLKN
ncbi:unnamed protein product [Trifolium pratense]|uniref:Uncharacterized protein n=1 Tax=Trifolium pratense TaxID=57577 RepID=A0ACB0IYJ6_TRIPR|nr:unnamed protein product [Trifolium pratense]